VGGENSVCFCVWHCGDPSSCLLLSMGVTPLLPCMGARKTPPLESLAPSLESHRGPLRRCDPALGPAQPF